MAEKLSAILKKDDIKDALLKATYHSIRSNDLMTKDINAAVQEAIKSKDLFKTVAMEKARPELVRLLANNLGFYYEVQGHLEAAEDCLKEAVAIQNEGGESSGDMAIHILATTIAQSRGDFEGSFASIDRLYDIIQKDEKINKVAGHYIKSLKAKSLLKLGRVKEASLILQEAYDHALKSAYGRKDADIVGRVLIYLSMAQSMEKDYDNALISAQRAVRIFNAEFKGEEVHFRQALSHRALGDALMGQKRYKEATKEYLFAENIAKPV